MKPANILLDEPDGTRTSPTSGWPGARRPTGATRTGTFLGHGRLLRARADRGRDVDGRADIYALGGVVFHCLTGRPPFARDSEFATLRAHLEEEPPAPGVSPGVDAAVRRAWLAKRPEDRYATAGEFADALTLRRRGHTPAVGAGNPRACGRRGAAGRSCSGSPPRWPSSRSPPAARSGSTGAVGATTSSRTFVDRVENLLDQSSSGRADVGRAIAAGLKCTIPPRLAAERITSAAGNRQSVLQQLGLVPQPTAGARLAISKLQLALGKSIEADRHYRDGFVSVGATPRPCTFPQNADFALAARFDGEATAAKLEFVNLFNPLAARFDARQWKKTDF